MRPERPTDIAAIASVTEAAFRDAPHTSHTEQYIVAALRNAGALAVSLVAESDGEIVGHVAASPVRIDGAPGWFGLGPLSVRPDHQRAGVGTALVYALIDELKVRRAAGCVLLGDPAYYRRFGFRAEPGLVLPDVPPEYFQALSLDGSLPRGVVAYHDAFEAQC
jgi:putative acetyltransferase